MQNRTLLVVGNGVLAHHVLYILSHGSRYGRIVVAARDADRVMRQANMLQQHALNLGYHVHLDAIEFNLEKLDECTAAIGRVAADVIFNTASMQSWWVVTKLPEEYRRKVSNARFGPWLPVHLSPTARLMEAVRASGSDATVVNAAFPDAVNPVLSRNGLGPAIGIGNIANVIPALRFAVSDRLQISVRDVDVRVCAHHFVSYRLSRLGHANGAPVFFQASANGRDVTDALDSSEIFSSVAGRYRRTGGVEGQPMTASSAVAVLEALASPERALVHAPGPSGLPGGYPVWLSESELTISLPEFVSLEEVVAVNEQGQVFDGIERIESDGTVRFAEAQMGVMKEMFGYECKELVLDDVHEAAMDLKGRFGRFLKRIGDTVLANAW